MTKSILNDCLLIKNEPLQKFIDYFKEINVKTFDTILSRTMLPEAENKQAILFILTAYSEDSPLVILRRDAKEEQEGICEYLNMPEYMRRPLIDLTDQTIRTTAVNYLEQFAGPEFRNLMFCKIQLNFYEKSITEQAFKIKRTEKSKDGEGEIYSEIFDQKEHGKAIKEARQLSKDIATQEKEIKNQFVYKGILALKEYKFQNIDKKINSVKDGICLESSKLIKIGRNG